MKNESQMSSEGRSGVYVFDAGSGMGVKAGQTFFGAGGSPFHGANNVHPNMNMTNAFDKEAHRRSAAFGLTPEKGGKRIKKNNSNSDLKIKDETRDALSPGRDREDEVNGSRVSAEGNMRKGNDAVFAHAGQHIIANSRTDSKELSQQELAMLGSASPMYLNGATYMAPGYGQPIMMPFAYPMM